MDDRIEELETNTVQNKSKLVEAKELIDSSKDLVQQADLQVEECKVGVSKAAENFDDAKRNFNVVTFQHCENLLAKSGFEYSSFDTENEPFELNIDENHEHDFSVKSLSTGRFTGLILAIIVATLTLIAWIYLAVSKLNINPANISPDTAVTHVNPVLNWIGTLGGNTGGGMIVGALILGFSALIMAWVVYAIRVNSKSNKNLRLAKDMYTKSEEYCMSKEECKREMLKVDEHLREATSEIGNFEMILNEQASVLKRVIHVEGVYDEEKEYHPTSKKTMRETEKVMRGVEKLLNTAITKNGKLNFKSVQALSNSRAIYADYLARIYD